MDQALSNALFHMIFRQILFENEPFEFQCFLSFFRKFLARYGGSPLRWLLLDSVWRVSTFWLLKPFKLFIFRQIHSFLKKQMNVRLRTSRVIILKKCASWKGLSQKLEEYPTSYSPMILFCEPRPLDDKCYMID